MGLAAAYCSIYKPAHVAGFKFPRRAFFEFVGRAFQHIPAVPVFFPGTGQHSGKKKKYLPFNMMGNFSPALFVAMDSLDRYSEKTCHFFLCFIKFCPYLFKFIYFHYHQFSFRIAAIMRILLLTYLNLFYAVMD